jgi:hypothetical protein
MESGDKIMKRLTMHANVQSLTEYVGVTRCADNTWCCGGQGSGCCSISSRLFALAATVGPATASTSISDSMSVTKPTMSSGPVNGIVSAISTVKVSTSTTLDPTSTPRVPSQRCSNDWNSSWCRNGGDFALNHCYPGDQVEEKEAR